MDKTELLKAGIDYDDGLKRFSGYSSIYEKYLKRFVTDEQADILTEQMEKCQYEEAFQTAHKLKGIIGNLSMNNLFEKISVFVDKLRNESDVEGAKAMYPELLEEYADIVKVLKKQFNM